MIRAAFLLVVVLAVGCQQKPTNGAKSGSAKKTYTRDEFKAMVMGKTEKEVIEAVGRPNSTSDEKNGESTWHYWDKVINPTTEKTSAVTVEFKNGKATEVRW